MALGRIVSQYDERRGFAEKLRQATSADRYRELFDQASEKTEELVQAPANDSGLYRVADSSCTRYCPHLHGPKEALQKVEAEMGVGIGRNQRCDSGWKSTNCRRYP